MRKLVSVILVVVLLFLATTAIADVDISGCSYDELVQLVNEAQKLMMESDKWQEVEVPAGVYKIGEDIPAGHWDISPVRKGRNMLTWGKKLNEDKTGILSENDALIEVILLYDTENGLYKDGQQTFVSWELIDGQYIEISSGSAVFSPYQGNRFTFK